jgi:hypothetical protein
MKNEKGKMKNARKINANAKVIADNKYLTRGYL